MKKFDISNLVITKIVDIYSHTLEEDVEARAVAKNTVFILKKDGLTTYEVGKETFSADGSHMVFLPRGTGYEMYAEREGACIVIEVEILDDPTVVPTAGEYVFDEDSDIMATASNALQFWNLRGPAYHSKCLSEIYNLITAISTVNSFSSSLVGKYHLIHRSVKYLERNYRSPDLYTPDLAEMSGVGETYYRNIFQAVFNCAPSKYIQQYRVNKAKELLVNSSGSVEDIAVAVGFANSSYFCKVFKSVTGMTPSEFAEKGRKLG